jgi:hypothetical protein
MELTALEQDLLGDLAEDDHALREIFEFVRLHHGSHPATVRRLGSELLATWNARGWLEIVDKLPDWPGYMAASMDEVLTLVDAAESLGVDFRGAGTWLRLTPQAYADVEWLSRAS